MKMILYVVVAVLLVAHQDFWWWGSTELLFGVAPPSLAYHMAYTVAAFVVMALLVVFAWPSDVEAVEAEVARETVEPTPPKDG